MVNENVIKRKGITLTLRDGKDYTILPLPIDDLIDIWPIVNKLEDKQQNVDITLLNDIKHVMYIALRGANEVTEDKVGQLVDLADLQEIIKVIVGQKTN